jgi:hypothetical protein
LFAVAVLAVLLTACFASVATAQPQAVGVTLVKETTNGDQATVFLFTITTPTSFLPNFPIEGGVPVNLGASSGSYTIVETVTPGWVLIDISCSVTVVTTFVVGSFGVMSYAAQTDGSSWQPDLANHLVTIQYDSLVGDIVVCTFTNDPAAPVGGVVIPPANTFAMVSPWLAVVGLVGCIGTVVIVAKKRQS